MIPAMEHIMPNDIKFPLVRILLSINIGSNCLHSSSAILLLNFGMLGTSINGISLDATGLLIFGDNPLNALSALLSFIPLPNPPICALI